MDTTIIWTLASSFNATPLANGNGGFCLIRRFMDDENRPVIRPAPISNDFYPLAEWQTAGEEQLRRMIV